MTCVACKCVSRVPFQSIFFRRLHRVTRQRSFLSKQVGSIESRDEMQIFLALFSHSHSLLCCLQFGTHVPETTSLIAQGGAYMSNLGNVDVGKGRIANFKMLYQSSRFFFFVSHFLVLWNHFYIRYIACDLDCSFVRCCCAGFGCCRQKMGGDAESVVFLAAGGTLVYRLLKPNETITVDSRSVVAMEETVQLGVTSNGRFGMCCCDGEGCFSTTLTGPGKVFLQSMNFKKFQESVQTTVIDDRGGPGGSGGGGE